MERTSFTQLFSFSLLLIYALLISGISVYAQGDNPRVDFLPYEWIQNINYTDSELDVITVNGFDDFNLGVDFAEVHVSQNPLNPLQYFGAYNINGA